MTTSAHTVAVSEFPPPARTLPVGALLRDPERRRKQMEAALLWVDQFDWEKSARDVEAALLERLRAHSDKAPASRSKRTAKPPALGPSDKAAVCKVSVYIPTYNGGDLLKQVVERIATQ
jgi:hypothetical protein